MNTQTKKDIEIALMENRDVICIQMVARATSPNGDNYVYENNPCVIQSLINMGWTK